MLNPNLPVEMLSLRKADPKFKECFIWLIANGMHQGRWTRYFSVHCLADDRDTKEYLLHRHADDRETQVVKYVLNLQR